MTKSFLVFRVPVKVAISHLSTYHDQDICFKDRQLIRDNKIYTILAKLAVWFFSKKARVYASIIIRTE